MHSVDLKGALKRKKPKNQKKHQQKASQKQGYKDVEIPADILH